MPLAEKKERKVLKSILISHIFKIELFPYQTSPFTLKWFRWKWNVPSTRIIYVFSRNTPYECDLIHVKHSFVKTFYWMKGRKTGKYIKILRHLKILFFKASQNHKCIKKFKSFKKFNQCWWRISTTFYKKFKWSFTKF